MNSEIHDLERLLRRTGLPWTRIASVLYRRPIKMFGDDSLLELYEDGVKECCFLNRPDVLRDIASYVDAHKCDEDYGKIVNITGQVVDFSSKFPIDIVLELVQPLLEKRILCRLPSFVQSISDGAVNSAFTLDIFFGKITLLRSADEQLVADGYDALFKIAQIILIRRSEDEESKLYDLEDIIEALKNWTIKDVSSIESLKKHFQFIVRLVELYIKQGVPDSPIYTLGILRVSSKHIMAYDKMIGASDTDDKHLAKINAIMDGLGDVFRSFLLFRSHASSIILDTNMEESSNPKLSDIVESVISAIIEHSYKKGRSTKLIELLLDALRYCDINKLRNQLSLKIRDTPASSENNFHSQRIKALEYLNEVQLPRSLQCLARQAIHTALWNGELESAIDRARLSNLCLPECMVKFCMYK